MANTRGKPKMVRLPNHKIHLATYARLLRDNTAALQSGDDRPQSSQNRKLEQASKIENYISLRKVLNCNNREKS